MAYSDALFVGWIRVHYTHWEPITLPAREYVEAARRLHLHRSSDPNDAARLLLPEREKPTGECHLPRRYKHE